MPFLKAPVATLRGGMIAGACCVLAIAFAGCTFLEPPPDPRPEADFSASPRQGTAPLTVTFTNLSRINEFPIEAYRWDFGDGNSSTRANPVHTYNQPGTYTVKLTVISADGTSEAVRENFIVIDEIGNFQPVGPGGGTIQLDQIVITVPNGAFQGEVAFGRITPRDNFLLTVNPADPIQPLASTFTLTHNAAHGNFFVNGAEGLVPTTITIPFSVEGIPPANLTSEHIFVLARLADGRIVPIPGELGGGLITIKVTSLPPRADYAVVYRPGSQLYSVTAEGAAKQLPTGWVDRWNIYASEGLLRQLTALRVGSVTDFDAYSFRNFFPADLQETVNGLRADVERIHEVLEAEGLRQPLLPQSFGGYSLLFFNMAIDYPTNFERLDETVWADSTFGHLVVDPLQLLAISTRNGQRAEQAIDAAQEFTVASVFAQEVFKSSFKSYGFPDITVQSNIDRDESGQPGRVSAFASLREGIATFLGQVLDNQPYARGFELGEVVNFGEELLAPVSLTQRGYGAASQAFFLYLQRVVVGGNDLSFLFEEQGDVAGVLEELRRALSALPGGGANLGAGAARQQLLAAFDRALQAFTGVNLGNAYASFVTDVAVDRPEDSILYPSYEELPPFTFNREAFGSSQVISAPFNAPTDKLEFSGSGPFADIPPLSSRVLELDVFPLTDSVVLDFNSEIWVADAAGQSLAVTVFQPGMPGIVLQPDEDMITLTEFMEDANDCLDDITIVVSNLSTTQTNTFAVTAEATAGLPVAENDVLRRYVQACDPSATWNVLTSALVPNVGARVTVLEVVSGAWRGPLDVSQTVWRHSLTIIEPPVSTTNTGLLVISGGSTGNVPTSAPAALLTFAIASGSVVALLQAVPNQPLVFSGETRTRSEDAILAYSFDQYMDEFAANMPDATWPSLLPMTRAAVRAMDATQEYLDESGATNAQVTNFVVTGASKRGWTTWLTAAADDRVTAIMPLVIDVLNMDDSIAHHQNAYCGFSDALTDYVDLNVFERFGSPAGQSIQQIIDPYSYIDEITIPKFLINSTGDQFFLPDSSRFYFNDLMGESRLFYVPNTDHGLGGAVSGLDLREDVLSAMLGFYIGFIEGLERPRLIWTYDTPTRLTVRSTPVAPSSVVLWQAVNEQSRDFRLDTIGAAWTATPLAPRADGSFVATVNLPGEEEGWRAYMVQATFAGPRPDANFIFTTPVRVVPDIYPDCSAPEEGETE